VCAYDFNADIACGEWARKPVVRGCAFIRSHANNAASHKTVACVGQALTEVEAAHNSVEVRLMLMAIDVCMIPEPKGPSL
jgi:hypothetical protein